ncbi:tetratricopeptide repeat protein [Methylomonas sp. CM2]|uniref:tetratricopeptide repeat protein n=1 Tax=Methylomonas sp. CM2 TaxID=3417647 RepID=UPI003CEB7979
MNYVKTTVLQSANKVLPVFVLIAVIFAVYFNGLSGPFLADDYPNIVDNNGALLKQLKLDDLQGAFSSGPSGARRPLAHLSFALNYYFAGQKFDKVAFKLTNVAIHVLNSILVFFISKLLIRAATPNLPPAKLAFVVALIWAVHPLQVSTVLYVVQRMTSLACLFTLGGLLVFLHGRLGIGKSNGLFWMILGSLGGSGIGFFAKENALLLPLLILVVEVSLLPRPIEKVDVNKLKGFYGCLVVLPAIIGCIYLVWHPEIVLRDYQVREFTLFERIMTEFRVLIYYLSLLFYPDNTQLALFHDDFSISKGFLQPITTLYSCVLIVFLVGLAILNVHARKMPFLSVAVLWFFAGHSMESTIYPLELVFEHRNYLPSIGVVFGVVVLIYQAFAGVIAASLLNALYAGIVVSLGLATYTRATIWGRLDSFAYFEVRNHPDSPRTNSIYANALELKSGPNLETYRHYLVASRLNTYEVASLMEVYMELNRLSHFHDPAQDKADSGLPKTYDDELILDSRYMGALKALLHREIIRRINARTYPLRTVASLRNAANCLIDRHYECLEIAADLNEWIDAALAQPDFFDVAMIYVIKAKVVFNQGNIDRAFEYMDKAIELSPRRMYFYAEKAHLLITLSKFDQAEQVLLSAEQLNVANGFDKQEFAGLRKIISTELSNATP